VSGGDPVLDDPGGFATGRRQRSVREMPACNIVVVGKTGVGKSTLINAVFGERLARTGVGEPVTPHFEAHRVDGVPVTIVDSRGIELGDDLPAVTRELDEEIDRRLRGDEAGRLHVLWYCVAAEGARFEPEAEGSLIRTVAGRLPVFVVLTKAYDPADPEVQRLADYVDGLELPVKGVLPVLAEQRYGMEAHGLEALIATTEASIDEGVRRAFANAQVLEVDTKLRAALARVDELVDAQDVSWRAFAFLRTTVGRGEAGEELFLRRVLDVVAEVGAVFGTGSVTDERVAALARGALGDELGGDGLAHFLRLVNRLLLVIPPIGPTVPVKYGGKLVTAIAAALAENHADMLARVRAQLLSRSLGRAAARVFADVARAGMDGEELPDAEMRRRFERYAEEETAGAAAT
jgi:GTP-binding protein EngB required for normal cell division